MTPLGLLRRPNPDFREDRFPSGVLWSMGHPMTATPPTRPGSFVPEPGADEETLVAETLAGSQVAFQLLVERYQGRVFALVRHYAIHAVELEDIVQDTFVKAYQKLGTYRSESAFSTWLFRIAINTALDLRKRAGRNPVETVEDPELCGGPARGPGLAAPEARLETQEIAEITHRCLDEMPDLFRTVLVMREFEELGYQEIADVLGISIGTVESRLFRARARFREALVRLFPEYAADR